MKCGQHQEYDGAMQLWSYNVVRPRIKIAVGRLMCDAVWQYQEYGGALLVQLWSASKLPDNKIVI